MTPDKYRLARDLFERLTELPADRQEAELEGACAEDDDLRKYVAVLLDAERNAPESFLARPAMEQAVHFIAERAALDAPAPGTRLDNFLIERRIGCGGMGTVFEARDTRLNRKVAVKVLSPAFSDDLDRLRRFRQEARMSSLLNHPNIVSIYDAELEQGRFYIATELVEGKTLRQLAGEHPLDRGVFLDVAIQICSALGEAHRAGIVHRDIKPENIMVRPDGIVKILDFGLAKLSEGKQGQHGDHSTSSLTSRVGVVAGTLAYLSPEQVEGKSATAQSDIFSLGVVLYELAAGVRPFTAQADTAVIAAILQHTPPPPSACLNGTEGRTANTELDAIIMRTIEKDPELRFQTAWDLRAALKLMVRGSQTGLRPATEPARSARLRPHFWLGIICAAIVAAILGSLFVVRKHFSATEPIPLRFTRLTDGAGEERFPSLTPDGKQVLYSGMARGKSDIYLQRVGGSAATNLTADSEWEETEPALSRDGSHIAFRSERAGGGLFIMESTGENPVRISSEGYLPAWSPDGKSIAYSDQTFASASERGPAGSRLHVLDVASGARRDLNVGDALQPNWSPHGSRIAYWGMNHAGQRDIWTVGADGSGVVAVTTDSAVDWNPVWAPGGESLYFISDRGGSMNVWRVAIDENTGRISGPLRPVTMPAQSIQYLSASTDGKMLAYSQMHRENKLYSVAFDSGRSEISGNLLPTGLTGVNSFNFSFSPDGSKIVSDTLGQPQEELWISNIDGSGRRRLVSGGINRVPQWSPNGDAIAFFSNRSGRYDEWTIRPDGSGLTQITQVGAGTPQIQISVWAEDGKSILTSRQWGAPAWLDPHSAQPAANLKPLPGFDAQKTFMTVAPPREGVLIGYLEGIVDRIARYDIRTHRVEQLDLEGTRPVWVPGSSSQFVYSLHRECYLYDLRSKQRKHLFSAGPNFIHQVSFDPQGRFLYVAERVRDSDIWLAQLE